MLALMPTSQPANQPTNWGNRIMMEILCGPEDLSSGLITGLRGHLPVYSLLPIPGVVVVVVVFWATHHRTIKRVR